ncbi:MAG: amino acid permease [candidate division KSB1 bacterium]|nr:amino acid permease [candidate division KSB1 bacterium]MDZ7334221.1 amino acid permease [candidate division KSB1 bacterium]MDZ7358453.1 amino acid permease [candidate division KSB1 bacterium]MDZ7376746.1 amino acid permease [candidate division KSB1 bacterium]MDZ7401073.1 amino acid permease [candidate division KSB1 bacterium]
MKRQIGLTTATSIVVANMIGTGIFVTTGYIAKLVPGPAWVMLCWAIGGFIAICGALCYGELSTRMPEVGGEYVYLKKLYHPLLGFLTGWTSLIAGFSAPIASAALGFSAYVFAGMNIPITDHQPFPQKLCATLIILIFTLIHYLGIKIGAKVQVLLTALKVMIILGLASLGLWFGTISQLPLMEEPFASFNVLSFGTAIMLVMFAYSGWNASSYIAGELKNPRSTLPWSLVLGTIIVIFLYLAINAFVLAMLPYSELKGTIAVVHAAAVKIFGDWISNGISALVSICLLSSLSAFIMVGPRVYFAMAKDKLFFPFADQIHPRYQVPGRSIVLQGAIAVAMVLISPLEQLLLYISFALNIFPWLAIIGLFIARRRGIGEVTAVRATGFPIVAILYLGSSLLLMGIMYRARPIESTAALLTVLAGIPCYFIWIKIVNWKKPL